MNRSERRKVAKTSQEAIDQLMGQGVQLMQVGNHAAAQRAFREVMEAHPKHAEALFYLGTIELLAGSFGPAEELLRRSLISNPKHSLATNNLGLVLHSTGRTNDAMDCYQSALKIDPENVEAATNIGRVYMQNGQLDEALKSVDDAIEKKPDFSQAHLMRGVILQHRSDIEAAKVAYEKAIEFTPFMREAHLNLSKISFDGENVDSALTSFKAVHEAHPEDVRLAIQYAEILYQTGQDKKAVEVCTPFLDKDDTFVVELMNSHSFACASLGDFDKAIDSHKKALALANNDGVTRLNYGRTLTAKGAYRDALEQFVKAFQMIPYAQDLHALSYVCERELEDPRYKYHYDFDNLVWNTPIEVPEGFENLESFNAALSAAMNKQDTKPVHPFVQNRRNASQSWEELLSNPKDDVFNSLGQAIGKGMQSFVNGLPEDPQHVFISRAQFGPGMSAAWATSVTEQERLVLPVERAGWISGYYFVNTPSESENESDKSSWLHFGQPQLFGSKPDMVDHHIKPVAGNLVLFPSYFWHGFEAINAKSQPLTMFGLTIANGGG